MLTYLTVVYTIGYMKTVINIKTDKEVKQNAQKVAEELGLSLSTVINAYLKQFVRSKEVHFSAASHMTPELEKSLEPIEADIQAGRNLSPQMSTPEQIREYFSKL